MNFFTSDTHFGHKKVIEFCKRPFRDTQEMEETIIKNWNSIVKPNDLVFHLGDVFFCGKTKAKEIMDQLNGRKILIRGNHDWWKDEKYIQLGFERVSDAGYSISEWDAQMSHFPYKGEEIDERIFDHQLFDDGRWLLHGHVHCAWKTKKKMINVGVDVWDFKPVSEDEIMKIISNI